MRVTSHEVPYVRQPVDLSLPVRYLHGPDSSPQPGVPRGTVVNFECNESEVYAGTSRTVWVHVPARYDPSEPAALMVFQDGALYPVSTGVTPVSRSIGCESPCSPRERAGRLTPCRRRGSGTLLSRWSGS